IRTTASRAPRIAGSGTSATSTELRPVQQMAFIRDLPRGTCLVERAERLRGPLPELPHRAGALRASLGADDLAGLQDLLEPPQVVADLLRGVLAQQLGHRRAGPSAGWVEGELDVQFGAAAAGSVGEVDGARVA